MEPTTATASRALRAALALLAGAAILSCGAPVLAKAVQLNGDAEVRQVYTHNDSQDETLTYSELVVGIDGKVDTRRIKASFTYQFGRKFAESGGANRENRHSLFARADIDVIENRLTVRTGAFAALLNRDLRGQVSFSPDQDNPNLVQTYSAYIEPHYHQPLRGIGDLDVNYRIGYYNVDENAGGSSGLGGLPGGAASDVPFDTVSDSINQNLQAKIGNRESRGRLRWDLIGTVSTEDIDRLDQRYRSYEGRAEIEYIVRRGIGIIGSVGYEHIRNSEIGVLRDATGAPIPGVDGGFQPDPAAPRRSIYAQSGLTFEGGLRLQPTRRTFLNVRAGRRNGQFSLNGDARFEVSSRLILSARLTDGIDSFGRLLTRDLDGTTVRSVVSNADVIGLGGCVFGIDPGSGTCLFNATQSITNATFRNRAAQFIVDFRHGRTSLSLAGIYSRREFLDSQSLQAPSSPLVDPGITEGADESFSLNARLTQALRGRQRLGFGLFANRYSFAISQGRRDTYVGGTADYSISLGRRLALQAAATVARRQSDTAADTLDATVSAGLRLQF